jgi:hypothetical protein
VAPALVTVVLKFAKPPLQLSNTVWIVALALPAAPNVNSAMEVMNVSLFTVVLPKLL